MIHEWHFMLMNTSIEHKNHSNLQNFTIKLAVWTGLVAVLFILRSFFLLIFLTFVFAYIQARGVDKLSKYISSRKLRVVSMGSIVLAVLTFVSLFLYPSVKQQAQVFSKQFSSYIIKIDHELGSLVSSNQFAAELLPQYSQANLNNSSSLNTDLKSSPTAAILHDLLSGSEDEKNSFKSIFDKISNIGVKLFSILSAFLLSILFSFLIVWDLPRLIASTRGLQQTKLGFIYEEVAEGIHAFAKVLGQALEAQLFIALLNTALTAGGIFLLGLGSNVAFLSMIVFLCSFIPVAGVFISSVPICILAMQQMGISGFFLGALLITVIHMLEAYVLNPRIYGAHLKMNPVIVLIILTVSGKLFHVWGLILGVPLCQYIFGHAIRLKKHT